MEIACSFRQITERHQRFEEDDEVFYAELRRQILLLTADDDDEEEECAAYTRRRKGSSNRLLNRSPTRLVNVWRGGNNGTRVFIPQIAKHSRHGRGRVNNQKKRAYKPVQRRQP